MKKPLIIGFTSSLRSSKSRIGPARIIDEISGIQDENGLMDFFEQNSGVLEERSGSEIKKVPGLSNSEICLIAALWGALQINSDVLYIPLTAHFLGEGVEKDLDILEQRIGEADGILLSTPTYFGDRSSISMRFIEMLRSNEKLKQTLRGKVFGGLAVGAKRNGGQETTLIYQMLDMMNLGMLGVGNDSNTTSQYGGTGHAGDAGYMVKDSYGLNTCIGTGRRIARVCNLMSLGDKYDISGSVVIGTWILQDRDNAVMEHLSSVTDDMDDRFKISPIDITKKKILPCRACNICPSTVGPDEDYRCVIKKTDDDMQRIHQDLLCADVICPVIYSPKNRGDLISVYQEFMERTRYLRRGDYVFSDRLVVPIIFEEIGAKENMNVRMITSYIRHHTVMHHPIIGWLYNGELLNKQEIKQEIKSAFALGYKLLAGRLDAVTTNMQVGQYEPTGYVLSNANNMKHANIEKRNKAISARRSKLVAEKKHRLIQARSKQSLQNQHS